MCGIAGFVDTSLNGAERNAVLEKMLVSIAHRGPDARGAWYHDELALGHNRLSILDLSEDGKQPMHFNNFSIVFNGEIYNYLEVREELKKKGYAFKTGTDTEVVLSAYQEWGEGCVDYFVGMWAFALWDNDAKKLFCSRDRFGIKPFYYIHSGTKFYFASEIKALKQTNVFSSDLNEDHVAMGLQLGWNHLPSSTYFNSIESLPAGCNLIYEQGKIKVNTWWDINPLQTNKQSYAENVSQLKDLLFNSIQLHMRSDVEVGCCLSGGLDSSTIASVVGTLYPDKKIKAFNVFYEGEGAVDERKWVKEVINKYPSVEPYYFSPSDDDIANAFDKAIYFADVPLAGSSPISQYFVMQLASQHGVKVLLDGQGSDESLGGYMHSYYRLLAGMMSKQHWGAMWKEINSHASTQQFGFSKKVDLFLKSVLSLISDEQKLYALEYKRYYPFLSLEPRIPFRLLNKKGSRLNNFLYHLNKTTLLPTLLQFEDRNSMAFSIESRVPFLDHRIVEFAFTLPDDAKIHEGRTKRILRDSMNGILPDAITNRTDKKGFVTPGEIKWLRGPLKFLLDQKFDDIPFLSAEKSKLLIDEFKAGNNQNANLVWRLATLKYWMQRI
jgi:asparagine synthase (glutamine-hydrolysing)